MSGLSFASPIGELFLEGGAAGLVRIFVGAPCEGWREEQTPLLHAAKRELCAYFKGELFAFSVPLTPSGTPFCEAAWRVMCQIPFGETWSYGRVAAAMGHPRAARAVGGAAHKNPIPIIIPCHRVVLAAGIGGYALDLSIKRQLLTHERAAVAGRTARASRAADRTTPAAR